MVWGKEDRNAPACMLKLHFRGAPNGYLPPLWFKHLGITARYVCLINEII